MLRGAARCPPEGGCQSSDVEDGSLADQVKDEGVEGPPCGGDERTHVLRRRLSWLRRCTVRRGTTARDCQPQTFRPGNPPGRSSPHVRNAGNSCRMPGGSEVRTGG